MTDQELFRSDTPPLRHTGIQAKVGTLGQIVILTDGPDCEPLNLNADAVRHLRRWLQLVLPDENSPRTQADEIADQHGFCA